jgi:hypothetical protein
MDRWVTLDVGSPGLMMVLQAELEAHGIPTFVPSLMMKVTDPAVVGGGNVFDWELQVPQSRLAEARELLRDRAAGGREALGDREAE